MYTPSANGGHARYAWELTTALAKAGRGRYEFELVSSQDLEDQYKSDQYGVHPILPTLVDRSQFSSHLAWALSRVTHYARRERRLLKWAQRRPDVDGVHFQEWTPWLASPLFRRLRAMGKKVFYTVHNIVPHRYPARVPKALMHRWIRQACLQCDGLFVHTDNLAEELGQFLGGTRQHPPIQVVPHGVWNVPASAKGPRLSERLREKRLLFFGAIRRNKGLGLLLDAMERLPGYSITIAGEPLEREFYRTQIVPQIQRVRAAGVRVDVIDHFVPEEQVGALFARHSAIVLPYTREFAAQSGVVFMALAHELPVVAAEVGGMRDLLAEFKIGTTFREAMPGDLATAVHSLFAGATESELLAHMRAAKDRFSWDAAARATIAGYAAADEVPTEANDCRIQTTPAL